MTALTNDRQTAVRQGRQYSDPVAASTLIFYGALVMLDASGNAVPASTATGLTVRGMAREHVDNSAGAAGDKNVATENGTWRFAHSGLDRTDIGATAYAVDDQTVDTDSTGRSAVGTIVDIDNVGVWVRID